MVASGSECFKHFLCPIETCFCFGGVVPLIWSQWGMDGNMQDYALKKYAILCS